MPAVPRSWLVNRVHRVVSHVGIRGGHIESAVAESSHDHLRLCQPEPALVTPIARHHDAGVFTAFNRPIAPLARLLLAHSAPRDASSSTAWISAVALSSSVLSSTLIRNGPSGATSYCYWVVGPPPVADQVDNALARATDCPGARSVPGRRRCPRSAGARSGGAARLRRSAASGPTRSTSRAPGGSRRPAARSPR